MKTAKDLVDFLREHDVVMVGTPNLDEDYDLFLKESGIKRRNLTKKQKEILRRLTHTQIVVICKSIDTTDKEEL